MNNILFKCPHCHKDITKESFANHGSNWTLIENYLSELKAQQLIELKEQLNSEIVSQLNEKHLSEINLVKQTMTNDFNNEIQSFKIILNNKESLIKQLNEQKALEIDKEKNTLINQFNETKNSLEIKVANKELEIKAMEERFNLEVAKNKEVIMNQFNQELNDLKLQLNNKQIEIDNLVKVKELESEKKELTIKNEYENRINELTQANREFKIINSKRKGENFEHEVEEELQKGFGLFDQIDKLTTGDRKADYLQTIKNAKKEVVGKIVYEVKNAEWSNGWINKLAQDVANNKTKYGILIATSFNDQYRGVPFIKSNEYDNIWITDSESFIFVGQMLRRFIEFEYELNQKINILTSSSNNDIIKELEAQKEKLNNYWSVTFPTSYKKIKAEMESLDKVSQSLINNSNKIKKSADVIKNQFFNKITSELTNILGTLEFGEE
ncbi:DUF2130 domain-containing protein [Mesoplasma corruscae]|uniref:DUF2130 domain-containing protein n=1 Tax=Mesoplasma corruscae TaxID=216874 RepID=A0A2S5RGH3_9MOLU|nr:DUF2130 domain-containing protein [Mesoplasma corruscae]PPE06225.1 hypothetical protein MCORR_v1c05290 [Mesoplasma corruscae]